MGVLNAGTVLLWQREERRKRRKNKNCMKRAWMDTEDGWHLDKHANAHIYTSAEFAVMNAG